MSFISRHKEDESKALLMKMYEELPDAVIILEKTG